MLTIVAVAMIEAFIGAGVVRSDFAATDVPLINLMLNTLVDFSRDLEPELYRRYLTIIFDGLRPRPEGVDPLPVGPLDFPRFAEAIVNWRR